MNNKIFVIDEDITFCAFRYALGRKTYVVEEVTSYLILNKEYFSEEFRKLVVREIKKAQEDNKLGMDQDKKKWLKVLNEFKKVK